MTPTRAVGYVRCSTVEQGESGLGLAAQRQAIERHAHDRGWHLAAIHEDVASGSSLNRPGLQAALEQVAAGEADCLIVLRLDRLSRSVADFAKLLQRFPRGIVALDLGVDPSTPSGEMVATVVCAMAQLERRLIGQRTREALEVRRQQGVRLGRPPRVSAEATHRIRELDGAGVSLRGIASTLNDEGICSPTGGRWYAPGIRRVLATA